MNEHELALAEYIVEMVKEYGELETCVSSEVEWDLNDLDVESLDRVTEDDEPVFRVGLTGEGKDHYQTLRARYNPPGKAHPAEYDYDTVPLLGTVWFRPTKPFSSEEIDAVVEQG